MELGSPAPRFITAATEKYCEPDESSPHNGTHQKTHWSLFRSTYLESVFDVTVPLEEELYLKEISAGWDVWLLCSLEIN